MKTIKIIDTANNEIIFSHKGDEIIKNRGILKGLIGYSFYTKSVLGKIKITKKDAIKNAYFNQFTKFFAIVSKKEKEVFCYRTPCRDLRCGDNEIRVNIEEA